MSGINLALNATEPASVRDMIPYARYSIHTTVKTQCSGDLYSLKGFYVQRNKQY